MECEVLVVSTLDPTGPGSLHDALQVCCTGPEKNRAIFFEVAGQINFPNDARWTDPVNWNGARLTGLKNVVICGDSSPGRIVITGHPYLLEDMQRVTWRHITWALEVPSSSGYASYWGPVRATASPGVTCKDVSFVNCSFVGGEDETPFGPSDWQERALNVSKDAYVAPAWDHLLFKDCFFGYGTSAYRGGYHNFGLMVSCAENSTVEGCFFAHENRRNEQVEGFNNTYAGNVVFNAGSMYFGCLNGRTKLYCNLFVPGNQTKQSLPHVLPIQVTPSSGTAMRKGPCSFTLYGNRRLAYGNIPELTANDVTMCDNQMASTGMVMSVNPLPPYAVDTERLISRYPDCWKSLDNINRVGAVGCPYVARAVSEIKVPDLRKPWVPGMVRGGNWLTLVTGRLADLGIPMPAGKTYLTYDLPSYEKLVAGAY